MVVFVLFLFVDLNEYLAFRSVGGHAGAVAKGIQGVLHLFQRVGDNTGVVSHSTAEFSQTVQGIIAVGLAAVRAKGVEAGEDIASGVVGVIIIEN